MTMFFKNLQLYRLPENWRITVGKLDEQLARKPFHACGSQDMESRGWLSPLDNGEFVHAVGGQWLIALGSEQRLLPPAVVRQEADRRAAELAEQQGYKLGRKQMKELHEQVEQEWMPRAFTRQQRTFAWIDPTDGWLVIDAASKRKAEVLIEHLRRTLDSFPVRQLRTERSPMAAMTDWLANGEAPDGFSIDNECTVESYEGERMAAKQIDPSHAFVREHIEQGRLATRLALTFNDRVSFVLTDGLEVKRVEFLDVVRKQLDGDKEDAEAAFSAEFALMAGELMQLLAALVDAMGGELGVAEGLL